MARGRRAHQVGDRLREELAERIRELRDPRIGFVTVTGVELSPDLRHARVHVSILEEGRREETLEALQRATGWLRRELARHARLKQVPELRFRLDESLRRGARVEELLDRPDRGPGDEE